MQIEPNRAAAEKLVIQLMAIRGGSGNEGDVAAAIVARLKAAGVKASQIAFDTANKRSPRGGDIGNLIVKLPGTKGRTREPRRMLMAHMDTVPLCVGCTPVKSGKLVKPKGHTALGADDRAGCATVLTAVETILKHKLPHPPLTLLFGVQEEIGLFGARFVTLAKLGGPKMAFNWDGGEPWGMAVGATGAYRMTIEITGIASHAGVHPERGISAGVIAAKAIASLEADGWHGLVRKGRYAGTSNVGVIEGGAATNVMMDRMTLRAEARSHTPAFRKRIVDAYQRAFKAAVKSTKNDAGKTGTVTFDVRDEYQSFRLTDSDPAVAVAKAAVASLGLTPKLVVTNGGLDANWINAHGVPCVTLGCGQHDIHTVNETLNLDEYHTACRVALRLATAE
ncbi:MAG: M20/M25/M40 family metallo-hydrolase [Phycisphaera sp.]|nr:M20/M25/M40 family metallo-hydrolase [Phycisphaera sp.]